MCTGIYETCTARDKYRYRLDRDTGVFSPPEGSGALPGGRARHGPNGLAAAHGAAPPLPRPAAAAPLADGGPWPRFPLPCPRSQPAVPPAVPQPAKFTQHIFAKLDKMVPTYLAIFKYIIWFCSYWLQIVSFSDCYCIHCAVGVDDLG
jgi:hypothetical protein